MVTSKGKVILLSLLLLLLLLSYFWRALPFGFALQLEPSGWGFDLYLFPTLLLTGAAPEGLKTEEHSRMITHLEKQK